MKTVVNRKELQDAIANISWLERLLICLFNHKAHKLARSYSIVTVDMLYSDHPLTEQMWNKSDELWAALYGINYKSS